MRLQKFYAVIVLIGWPAGILLSAQSDPTPAQIEQAVAAIVNYELGQPRTHLAHLEQLVQACAGRAELVVLLEERLIPLLDSQASYECRLFVCEQLWRIGTDRSVPVLRKLLSDEKTVHMACLALRGQASPAAREALRQAAASADGKALLCVLGVLGDLRDGDSVNLIGQRLTDPEDQVAEAAAAALGKIGTSKALDLLLNARAAEDGQRRNVLTDASLRCAQAMVADGMPGRAAVLYQALLAEDVLAYRRAALLGLIDLGGKQALDLVLKAIHGDDPVMQAAAIARVRTLKGAEVTVRLAEQLPKLAPRLQVYLIEALAYRADAQARAAVVNAASAQDEQVRIAAVLALGTLGDAATVPLLVRTAGQAGTPEEKQAAIMSLRQLSGQGVDAAIVAEMKACPPETRVQLIGVLQARDAVDAVPTLLEHARDSDSAVRQAALRALGYLAGPDLLPRLIELLLGMRDDEPARPEAEKTVAAVARKIREPARQADAVISALAAASTRSAKRSLLEVLSTIGGDKALAAVAGLLADPDASVRETALRVLANWADPAAMDVLWELAANAPDQSQRVLALRGYIRLIGSVQGLAPAQLAGLYGRAMGRVNRPEEKKLLLAGLSALADAEALKLAWACLGDDAVKEEAAAAVLAIASPIVRDRPALAKFALQKAMLATGDTLRRGHMAQIIAQAEAADPSLRNGPFQNIEPVWLFDGRTFEGWEGATGTVFRIEDGAIVGGTTKQPVARNEFLTTRREFRDFELRLRFRLVGQNANAGVQIRSRRIPGHHEMIGYQADLGQDYWGCLYDESRRNRVLARPDAQELKKVLRPDDWNDYTIRCVGRRIQLWINGYQTVDYTEPDEKIEQTGLIGLQIHAGPPSEAWYKDILIRELPRSD